MEEGTYFSDLRKEYGHEKPYNIKMWCLGNEMDGSWQMGEKTGKEYGRIANEAAKQMRAVDPDIELVACGSCANDKSHSSYPEWDRLVLEECYENVDYLSLHRYYSYDPEAVKGTVFPAQFTVEDLPCIAKDMTQFIDTVCAAADYVKGLKYSDKTINICFDEWGIISSQTAKAEGLDWTERKIPEKGRRVEGMNVIDAVLFGSILIAFINKCDRVKIACQSIVIPSMIAADPNGGSFKQTTYYPFQQVAKYGDGVALTMGLESPTKETDGYGEQPFIQTAAVYDEVSGIVTVFVSNLSVREKVELDETLQFDYVELFEHIRIYDEQPLAMNSLENPERIVPKEVEISDKVILLPLSWNVLRYRVKGGH